MTGSGYLWLATPSGLYKRDPVGLQTLIIEAPIFDIHYYSGSLWVTTNASVYQLDPNTDDEPVSYPLTTLTPPITAIYGAAGSIWVGAQDGIASAVIDPTSGALQAWQEYSAEAEPFYLKEKRLALDMKTKRFGLLFEVLKEAWPVMEQMDSTQPFMNSKNLPSNLITDLSVSDSRIIVTTETGTRLFKPILNGNEADIVSLFADFGIPAEAGTASILSVADTGDRLWMYTKPTQERIYGGLMTLEGDDPNQVLRTEGI